MKKAARERVAAQVEETLLDFVCYAHRAGVVFKFEVGEETDPEYISADDPQARTLEEIARAMAEIFLRHAQPSMDFDERTAAAFTMIQTLMQKIRKQIPSQISSPAAKAITAPGSDKS